MGVAKSESRLHANFLLMSEVYAGLYIIENLVKLQHEHIMFLELSGYSDDLPGGVIYAHENSATFRVKECNDGFHKDPFGLMVLDREVIILVLDVYSFRRHSLPFLKRRPTTWAINISLLHVCSVFMILFKTQ